MLFFAIVILILVVIFGVVPTIQAIACARSYEYKFNQRIDAVSRS